jgi:5'-deoxynucleotidase YfbR-like HD superfamily hydrolase
MNREGDSRLDEMAETNFQNISKFLKIAGMLKRTPRTGWVEVSIYQPESVADHTFRTAILSMLYADIEGLDPLKLLRMALIHDLPEALTGDLTPDIRSVASDPKGKIHNSLERISRRKDERGTSRASTGED